jgi:lipopolysaccharide/colanic/teichoic acid biosynthesis glycosyltransferase
MSMTGKAPAVRAAVTSPELGEYGRCEIGGLPPIDVADVQRRLAQHSRLARRCKRLFDILFAAVLLLLAAPLLALLALLIPLESEGPAIYRQPRMGYRQRPFTIVKFRTMGPGGKVTRIGKLVRPLGIDELPQLWNVLKGDMSVVGPRPEVLDRVPRHERELPDYWARHLMRPGITGWAQVNGLRGRCSIAERLRFDLEYISHWSLWLDARVLFGTTAAVWRDTRRAWRL